MPLNQDIADPESVGARDRSSTLHLWDGDFWLLGQPTLPTRDAPRNQKHSGWRSGWLSMRRHTWWCP